MFESINQTVVGEAIEDCLADALRGGESLTLHVQGDCMQPVLLDQQRVQVYRQASYLPGDIVAYYCDYQKKRLVHRVLVRVPYNTNKIKTNKASGGEKQYLIMADNASKPDVFVSEEKILGKIELETNLLKRSPYFVKGLYWFVVIAGKKALGESK